MNVVRSAIPGNTPANSRNKVANILTTRLAPHLLQHLIIDMLQRHIDIAAHFVASRNGLDQFIIPMIRMRVKQPHPEIAVDLLDFPQQFAKQTLAVTRPRRLRVEVLAVKRRVLRNEIDLARTADTSPRISARTSFTARLAMFPANARDTAKRAGMITTLGDLHVGVMFRRQPKPRRRVIGNIIGTGPTRKVAERCARSSRESRERSARCAELH